MEETCGKLKQYLLTTKEILAQVILRAFCTGSFSQLWYVSIMGTSGTRGREGSSASAAVLVARSQMRGGNNKISMQNSPVKFPI